MAALPNGRVVVSPPYGEAGDAHRGQDLSRLPEFEQALQAADEQRVPPGALTRVGGPLGRCADTDDDGRVSREDWAVFVSRVCRGDITTTWSATRMSAGSAG